MQPRLTLTAISNQPTKTESRRIMTETIKTLLEPIQNRLNAITPGPWFASRYYVGAGADQSDPDAEVAKASSKIDAAFIASAPTDQARLLAAVQAVLSICDNDEGEVVTQADGAHVPIYLILAAIESALTEAR